MGNLRFELQKIHSHERGDLFVFLDKAVPENAAEGADGEIGSRGKERGGFVCSQFYFVFARRQLLMMCPNKIFIQRSISYLLDK